MLSAKSIHKFSHRLNVLYIEDDDQLRREMAMLFEPFFGGLELAENGEEGLQKYNDAPYDIVITDVSMPHMGGLEMIDRIREINPEQKIIVVTAHDEQHRLISMIRKGISSFLLKPVVFEEMLKVIYPVCRDADTHKFNAELFDELSEERNKLKQQVRRLEAQLHTIAVKNQQVEELYFQNKPEESPVPTKASLETGEDEEKVLLIAEDVAEIKEMLSEIPDLLILYCSDSELSRLHTIADHIAKISNSLLFYTPYMDILAKSLEELAYAIAEGEAFASLIEKKSEMVLKLFDAVCIDLTLYMDRFSTESMAMHNIHHIHQPTAMSIQQIIGLMHPEDVEDGEIEFF